MVVGYGFLMHSCWCSMIEHWVVMIHWIFLFSILKCIGPDIATNTRVAPFETVNYYLLMCRLLDITPAPNNGTSSAIEGIIVSKASSMNRLQNMKWMQIIIAVSSWFIWFQFTCITRPIESTPYADKFNKIKSITFLSALALVLPKKKSSTLQKSALVWKLSFQ